MPVVKIRVTVPRVYYNMDKMIDIDPRTGRPLKDKKGNPRLLANHFLRREGETIEVNTDHLTSVKQRLIGSPQDEATEVKVGKETWLCDWGVQVGDDEPVSVPEGNTRTFGNMAAAAAGVL